PVLAPHLGRRDAKAFLEIVEDAFDALAAGPLPADVGVVEDVHHEADRLALVEHRLGDEKVGQMPRAEERIVEQNGVAGSKGVDRMSRERVLDGEGHRAHVTRRVRPLSDHPPPGVKDGHGTVRALTRLLGVGGPVDRRADLDRDRLERAPDDAEGDRIHDADAPHQLTFRDHAGRPAARLTPEPAPPAVPTTSTIRFAYSSTDAVAPGGRTVVDSRSSTIAGPVRCAPGASA